MYILGGGGGASDTHLRQCAHTLKYQIELQSIRYQAREIVFSDWLTTRTDLCSMISQISKM